MSYYNSGQCCRCPRTCGCCFPPNFSTDFSCGCSTLTQSALRCCCDPCNCCCQTFDTDDRSSSPRGSDTSLIDASSSPESSNSTEASTSPESSTLSSAGTGMCTLGGHSHNNQCCDPCGACCLLNIIKTMNELQPKQPVCCRCPSRRILDVVQTCSEIIKVVRNPDGTVTSEREPKLIPMPDPCQSELPNWVKECTVVYEPNSPNRCTHHHNGACCTSCQPQPCCGGGNNSGCCQVFLQSYEDFIRGAEFEGKQQDSRPMQTEEEVEPEWISPVQTAGGSVIKSDKISDGKFKMFLPKCALFRDGVCCCSAPTSEDSSESADVTALPPAHWSTLAKPPKRTLHYTFNPNPPFIEDDVTMNEDTQLETQKENIRQIQKTLHTLKQKLRQAKAKISKTEQEKQRQAALVRKALEQVKNDRASTVGSSSSLVSDLDIKMLEEEFGSAMELNQKALQAYEDIKAQYLAMEKHLVKMRPKIPVVFSAGEFIEQGGKLYRLKV